MKTLFRVAGILCAIAAILCIVGPILCCIAAYQISDYYGVPCSERGPEVIIVCGHDIGGTVYTMAMMPWLMFLTVPVSLILFPISGLLLGVSKACT